MGFSLRKAAKSVGKAAKGIGKAALKAGGAVANNALNTATMGASGAVEKAMRGKDKRPQRYDEKTGDIVRSNNSPAEAELDRAQSGGFFGGLFKLFGF